MGAQVSGTSPLVVQSLGLAGLLPILETPPDVPLPGRRELTAEQRVRHEVALGVLFAGGERHPSGMTLGVVAGGERHPRSMAFGVVIPGGERHPPRMTLGVIVASGERHPPG